MPGSAILPEDRQTATQEYAIMSLDDQLAKIREGAVSRIPEDKRAVMARATQELRESGIIDKTIKVGDALPAFALKNAHGGEVTSTDLLANGTVVLTVFRGHW